MALSSAGFYNNRVVAANNIDLTGATLPAPTMLTDGQLLIAHTALNANGSNIDVGVLTSPDSSLTISYSNPNITITANGSMIGETITGNTGGALSPTAGNWNLPGNNNANNGFAAFTTGSGSTLTIHSYGTAKWVVNPIAGVGTHQTIQSAINSAVSGETIFITPGTYTENLALKAGVNLTAYDCDPFTSNVTIVGQCSFSSAGTVTISGIRLQTNSNPFLAVTGSAASIVYLINCYLLCNYSGAGISFTSSSGSSQINVSGCWGNLSSSGASLFSASSSGALYFFDSRFDNSGSSSNASTMSAGTLAADFSNFSFPITTSGTNGLSGFSNCGIGGNITNSTSLTVGGSGSTNAVLNCQFNSGTATCISVGSNLTLVNATMACTNTTTISGAGTVYYAGVSTFDRSGTLNITTTTTHGLQNQLGAPAYHYVSTAVSYAVLAQDAIIGVTDNSAARTITMPNAKMAIGQRWTIKDQAGTAASANNITVSGNGANIDGAATYVINTNFGSVDLYWNGTNFFVI